MNADQAKALREPFPPELIGKLPRLICKKCGDAPGKVCAEHKKQKCGECGSFISTAHIHLDYVGHAAVTDRLLQVDCECTWYPLSVEERASVQAAPNELWIWLTVCGVSRMGVGDGETSKIRMGDAIRNGAMRFGVGLDLWAKEDLNGYEKFEKRSERASEEPKPEPKPIAFDNETLILERALADAMRKFGTYETDKHLVKEKQEDVEAKRLPLAVYKKWLRDKEATVREDIKVMGPPK